MKKILKMLSPLAAAVALLVGCQSQGGSKTAYERVQTALLAMQTYEAEADVTYISNKTSHSYETKQQCRVSGEYRIEVTGPEKVAGNVTVSDGKTICQYNSRISGKLSVGTTEAPERGELFLTSFIRNYVKSQEVTVAAAKAGDEECTVLEAKIPGDHPYMSTEKLWVSNATLKPVKLTIYDAAGGERIIITYKTFEYNVTLSDNLFRIE